MIDNYVLRDVLRQTEYCTRIQIGRAFELASQLQIPVVDAISQLNYMSGEQIAECYSRMSGKTSSITAQSIPTITYIERPDKLEVDALGSGYFDEQEYRQHQFIPLNIEEETYMFMVDPFNDDTIEFINLRFPCPWRFGALSSAQLDKILVLNFSSYASLDTHLEYVEGDTTVEFTDTDIRNQLLAIFRNAKRNRASDIHFIPGEKHGNITARVDGDIVDIGDDSGKVAKPVLERYIHMLLEYTKVEDTNDEVPRTGRAKFPMGGTDSINLRVSLIPGKFGTDVNMRIINDSAITVDRLGFTEDELKTYRKLLNLSKGIIFIVGPTGSGKSTTLYGGLSMIERKKIMTVEDPVEYIRPGLLQVDIDEPKGVTWDIVIKAFLRHDPDIVVIGETRDKQVGMAGMNAAATGHLVLTTMHTNSSITAPMRLITMGVDKYLVCEQVAAVMSQRLLKKICPHCAKEKRIGPGHPALKYGRNVGDVVLEGEGCPACKRTGYLGRTACIEILRIDANIRDGIERQLPTADLLRIAREKSGFKTMLDDAIYKASQNIIPYDQVAQLDFDML